MKPSEHDTVGGQLARALRLYEAFKARRRGLTIDECAAVLGLTSRSAYRVIHAMCDAGVPLYQEETGDARGGRYAWCLLRNESDDQPSLKNESNDLPSLNCPTVRERSRALGKRIQIFRQRRRISQRKLHDLAGIELANLCRIERGSRFPRFDTLCHIADALDVPLSKIFEEESSCR